MTHHACSAVGLGSVLAAIVLLPAIGCEQGVQNTSAVRRIAMDRAQPQNEYAVAFDQLKVLLPRAVERAHWAVVHKEIGDETMQLEALTPADLPVDIRAARLDDSRCGVQVKVGMFNHADQEQWFHNTLLQAIEEESEKAAAKTAD